jgi:hypothetical protein
LASAKILAAVDELALNKYKEEGQQRISEKEKLHFLQNNFFSGKGCRLLVRKHYKIH